MPDALSLRHVSKTSPMSQGSECTAAEEAGATLDTCTWPRYLRPGGRKGGPLAALVS